MTMSTIFQPNSSSRNDSRYHNKYNSQLRKNTYKNAISPLPLIFFYFWWRLIYNYFDFVICLLSSIHKLVSPLKYNIMPWNHIEEKPKFLHKPSIFSQTKKKLCPSKSDHFTKFLFSGNLLEFFTTRCQQHHLFLEGRKKTWTLYKGRSSMEGIEEFF